MRRFRTIGGITMALAVVLNVTSASGGERRPRRASLTTFEGVVRSIEKAPGEGGVPLDVARLGVDGSEPRELSVVLAPGATLRQINFEVQVGDRLRVRVFLSDDDSVLAHKVLNVTRGTMIRLRTLTRVPLWDGNGQWQGGPCRTHRGGPRHQGPHH